MLLLFDGDACAAHAAGEARGAQEALHAGPCDVLVVDGGDHPDAELVVGRGDCQPGVLEEVEVILGCRADQRLQLRRVEAPALAGVHALEELLDQELDVGTDLAHLQVGNCR